MKTLFRVLFVLICLIITTLPSISQITITSPNGGEIWIAGSQHAITWTSNNVDNVLIAYSTDMFNTINVIAASVQASLGTYTWTVPTALSTLCQVYIVDVSNPAVYDYTDGDFMIHRTT